MNHSPCLLAALLLPLLSGCGAERDAAAEAPIEVAPGKYSIDVTAAGLAQLGGQGPGRTNDEICVTAREARSWPRPFVRNYLFAASSCSIRKSDRIGNAISGEVSCPMDPRAGQGRLVISYTGTLDADATDIAFNMKATVRNASPEVEAALAKTRLSEEGVDGIAKARRIGDCD